MTEAVREGRGVCSGSAPADGGDRSAPGSSFIGQCLSLFSWRALRDAFVQLRGSSGPWDQPRPSCSNGQEAWRRARCFAPGSGCNSRAKPAPPLTRAPAAAAGPARRHRRLLLRALPSQANGDGPPPRLFLLAARAARVVVVVIAFETPRRRRLPFASRAHSRPRFFLRLAPCFVSGST